jgi:hypothetical protein
VTARVTLVMGNPVGVTSNWNIVGTFDACTLCSIQIIGNSMQVWKTGQGTMPSDYPAFLCSANSGELHYSCCLEATVHCEVTGSETTTWGAIKEMHR